MGKNIKEQLFFDYLRERRNEHIDAVVNNVEQGDYTFAEARNSLEKDQIYYSMEQQYKYSLAIGGISTGQGIFIKHKDMPFVNDGYLNNAIETIINELNMKDIVDEIENYYEGLSRSFRVL
ncbi:hypothetical protein MHZ36_12665 [Staphylococcus sp. ACRSN]|uniref:hypothetical protein n=1 Tax=Staphylococcus TaxID=1279 RepID=UPI0011C86A57|nr:MULTISPECIES: hypothetical protein [Staphylococcus]MCG7340141.1 hypothetical protein [Staphylococcus sp. ACRSN]MEB6279082.1 hypothetical protein [Staphylococcus gallinarum]